MVKRKPSTKKTKKKISSYLKVRKEHLEKIVNAQKTGKRLESIPQMEKEIAAFEKDIKTQERRLQKRKKRGSKTR